MLLEAKLSSRPYRGIVRVKWNGVRRVVMPGVMERKMIEYRRTMRKRSYLRRRNKERLGVRFLKAVKNDT